MSLILNTKIYINAGSVVYCAFGIVYVKCNGVIFLLETFFKSFGGHG